jgi:hypothetical protein
MKVKLCPLKQITIKTDINTTKTYFMECDEEVCAWFIEETKECAIKCIATKLERGAVHVIWEKQLQPAL